MKRIFILLLFVSTTAAGEILDWPLETKEKWQMLPASRLPAGVHPQDPEDPERALDKVAIRRIDVDGDGIADLIVDTGRGGTGGSYVFVYRRQGKHYREVLAEQGGISASRQRGCLECWSRAGGMEYRHTVYRFNGRRFVELFTDSLKGPLEDDRFEVIKRRKPK